MRILALAVLLTSIAPGPADAQQIPMPHPMSSRPAQSVESAAVGEPGFPIQPTHWKRGALIGGVGAGAALVGLAYFFGCSGSCIVDAIAYSPIAMIPGAFIGALVGGLFPKDNGKVGTIRGPSPDALVPATARDDSASPPTNAAVTPSSRRRSSNWKRAILLGAVAGTIFGAVVASQDGDEGSDRPFSDRLSDGLLSGAMLAVPVTVIFAMLAGD